MHVTNHIVSHKFADTLHTLTNDCRTQMSYMERFCNVWSAIVDHDGLWRFCLFTSKTSLIFLHFCNIICKVCLINFQIEEARFYRFCHRKNRVCSKFFHHFVCDHKWGFFVFLGGCHGAVTLVFTKIRSV